MRRVHLHRHSNILKRLRVHGAAFNLGLVMRKMLGKGTPRGFQDCRTGLLATLARWLRQLGARPGVLRSFLEGLARAARLLRNSERLHTTIPNFATSTTGC